MHEFELCFFIAIRNSAIFGGVFAIQYAAFILGTRYQRDCAIAGHTIRASAHLCNLGSKAKGWCVARLDSDCCHRCSLGLSVLVSKHKSISSTLGKSVGLLQCSL